MKSLIVLTLCTLVLNGGTLTVIDSGRVETRKMKRVGVSSNAVKAKPEYREVRIKDEGVERVIYIEVAKKEDNSTQKSNTLSLKKKEIKIDKLTSRVGLVMKFNKKIDIDNFAARFGLKFKTKLKSIDYYIFDNQSEFTDIELISTILQTEKKEDISTIRANWPMDVELN